MAVETEGDPLALVPAVRAAIERLDPDVPISEVRTLETVVADSLSRTTFTMTLLVLGAAVALFLGSVGIYGVISYIVTQRTAEIGVRLALGASPGSLGALVLSQGMRLAAAGVVVGLLAALGLGRVIASLLYGVTPMDPVALVAGSLSFLAVAAVATLVPAMRAARTPPAEALRGGD
jgi:ABC-type antimicrobial peptide transport system permease subunit